MKKRGGTGTTGFPGKVLFLLFRWWCVVVGAPRRKQTVLHPCCLFSAARSTRKFVSRDCNQGPSKSATPVRQNRQRVKGISERGQGVSPRRQLQNGDSQGPTGPNNPGQQWPTNTKPPKEGRKKTVSCGGKPRCAQLGGAGRLRGAMATSAKAVMWTGSGRSKCDRAKAAKSGSGRKRVRTRATAARSSKKRETESGAFAASHEGAQQGTRRPEALAGHTKCQAGPTRLIGESAAAQECSHGTGWNASRGGPTQMSQKEKHTPQTDRHALPTQPRPIPPPALHEQRAPPSTTQGVQMRAKLMRLCAHKPCTFRRA